MRPLSSRCDGRTRALAWVAMPLLVLSFLGLVSGRLWSAVVVLLCVWSIAALRQRVTLSERELVVRGRFTTRRVALADVEGICRDRTWTPWVAAAGQRPFRMFFVPTVERRGELIEEVRRRAAAAGAAVDTDAPLLAPPPKGTSPVFSL